MTERLPEFADLPAGLVLDGELVAFALDGRASFPLLSLRVLHGRALLRVRVEAPERRATATMRRKRSGAFRGRLKR